MSSPTIGCHVLALGRQASFANAAPKALQTGTVGAAAVVAIKQGPTTMPETIDLSGLIV
ncbi:hypothetical protein SynA1825c_01948 [Synechococcus sp. A18-25c]|nr:hypothetical protein SynA1825c_01948 [Synechococcus sp. A18-25c]